jgi:hypothetical protein
MNTRAVLLAAVWITIVTALIASATAKAAASAPTADEVAKMRAAMPEKPRVEPAEPRKLLVFSRSWGYYHSAIPYGAKAIEIMARKTGAFEAVLADDDIFFEPDKLGRFDAVVFNNTNNEIFLPQDLAALPAAEQKKARQRDAMLKESLVRFLKNGGGLAVIHAGVASFRQWPEFGEIIGARFDNHPWGAGSTAVLRIEEPDHPLTAAFKEPYFVVTDELYQVKSPYSREKVRVLVSIDPKRTTITPRQRKAIHREDMDFPMTWVKDYGRGRVFYCALGHQHELFWNPVVLQHYLDGIQFVLGDIEADTTPRAKVADR